MTIITAFAGQKGGSGKSTLAIAAAAEFYRKGYRTLLVDADPQGTSATWGVVAAEEGQSCPDVVMMGSNLHQQLESVARGYDIVVVDCPGRDDDRQRGALAVADMAVLPVTPDTSDIWALSGSIDLVRQAQTFRPRLVSRLLLNKVRAKTTEASSAREMLDQTGLALLETQVGLRITYGRFAHAGKGVVDFEPGGKAADEIQRLIDEFESLLQLDANHEEMTDG